MEVIILYKVYEFMWKDLSKLVRFLSYRGYNGGCNKKIKVFYYVRNNLIFFKKGLMLVCKSYKKVKFVRNEFLVWNFLGIKKSKI